MSREIQQVQFKQSEDSQNQEESSERVNDIDDPEKRSLERLKANYTSLTGDSCE